MNVPKIRFPKYNYEWNYEPLNKYVERIVRKNKNKESDLVLTISAQYGLVDQCTFFNRNVSSSNLDGYYLLYKGDFAYNKSYSNGYPWGAVKRLNLYDKGVVSSLYICFNTNNLINSDYLQHYFETNKWYSQISSISVEGARNHGLLNIAVNDFFNTEHFFPKIDEQKDIAKFLNLLDKKIELQSKKIEDLKLFKLCTANIIFKDDSLLCKKQIKELCNIAKGKQINSEFLSETGKYYMLNGGINPSGFINEYNTNENTISISEGGNSCGYVNFNKSKFWAGGHCYTVTPIDINNIYLYQILKYNENKIMDLRVGSGLPNIQKKDLENFSVYVHHSNVQNKIATILSSIDKLIDLEEKKISNIEKLKKGLMQNMFV